MRSVFEGDRRLARDAGMRRQPPVRAGCGAGALGAVTVVRFSQQGCLRAGAGVNGHRKALSRPGPVGQSALAGQSWTRGAASGQVKC